ncbi:short chain dehydrogenase [Mycolicibacterium phlei]|uniref:SDR family oxidoreductase n=1 Tax=Mycobacteroides chelonae TaxID=1774 RepID=UPI000618AB8E|nr:SDR family oxidoreductase [Mycobacteroides chelonae]VEG20528.1 short chain dehydrogenase [Mycolicibacterium phlei]AKC40845.1 short-chain dehydrogenase [Mycobacteroides chelonae]ANB00572.1 short-chain dehydrogenase [Mycobacteroides chelonae CCUG 47445]OLT81719.1 short-chain dehydrogenase [Mycobacteroides chelonae]ORV14462.1 short-chain dehydrogenase [Mycobacteroides chelonae]
MTQRHNNVRRTVAITGGARGIGRATGEAFLRAGAKVAIGDIDADLAERTALELSRATGGHVCGLPVDVTNRESFAAFLDRAEAQLGLLDTLVNNAGIMPTGLFSEEDNAMTDRMIAINLAGVLTGSKLAVHRFSGRPSRIVNIASLAGVSAHRGVATYCATKHAVLGFSEALRLELQGSGISVTVVLPGIVRTELSAGSSTPQWARPVTEVGPEDVARAIVEAVMRGRDKVVVPRVLGGMLRVMGLLPDRLRQRLERIAHLDTAFTDVDPVVRACYHDRITRVSQ